MQALRTVRVRPVQPQIIAMWAQELCVGSFKLYKVLQYMVHFRPAMLVEQEGTWVTVNSKHSETGLYLAFGRNPVNRHPD